MLRIELCSSSGNPQLYKIVIFLIISFDFPPEIVGLLCGTLRPIYRPLGSFFKVCNIYEIFAPYLSLIISWKHNSSLQSHRLCILHIIRILIAVAAVRGSLVILIWRMHFFHGDLWEEIYMTPALGISCLLILFVISGKYSTASNKHHHYLACCSMFRIPLAIKLFSCCMLIIWYSLVMTTLR